MKTSEEVDSYATARVQGIFLMDFLFFRCTGSTVHLYYCVDLRRKDKIGK